MGLLGSFIAIVRVVSVLMACLSAFTIFRTVQNSTLEGFGALQVPDIAMVVWNVVCTVLAGSAWFATPKKIIDTIFGLLNGVKTTPETAAVVAPQSGLIVSGTTIQDVLAAVRTWLDQNAGNDQPLAIQGQAFGFELLLSAKPLPRPVAEAAAAISQTDLQLLLNRLRLLEQPPTPVA